MTIVTACTCPPHDDRVGLAPLCDACARTTPYGWCDACRASAGGRCVRHADPPSLRELGVKVADLYAGLTIRGAPLRFAWTCPRCDRVNAPHVDQCSCPAASPFAGGVTITVAP